MEALMAAADPEDVEQDFVKPLEATAEREWPRPTRTTHPMNPSDALMDDGRIFSGALDRVKIDQHDGRVVLQWRGDARVRPRSRSKV